MKWSIKFYHLKIDVSVNLVRQIKYLCVLNKYYLNTITCQNFWFKGKAFEGLSRSPHVIYFLYFCHCTLIIVNNLWITKPDISGYRNKSSTCIMSLCSEPI